MSSYEIFQRIAVDGRAPEMVFLEDDYELTGDIEAESLRGVFMHIEMMNKEQADDIPDIRPIRTGDVVRDPEGKCWIWTPMGVWASVQAFEAA